MMVAAAKKLGLKFEDVYLPGTDSPDGTWKGIVEAHSYEFVFLCFMNAFAKQVDSNFPPILMHGLFVIWPWLLSFRSSIQSFRQK